MSDPTVMNRSTILQRLRRRPHGLAASFGLLLLTAASLACAGLEPRRPPSLDLATRVHAGDDVRALLRRLQVFDADQLRSLAQLPALQRLAASPGQPVGAQVDARGRLQRLSAQLPLDDVESTATLQLQVSTRADGSFTTALSLASLPAPDHARAATIPAGFLASPLANPRVSSGWGWRVNPIFHQPEFHLGVDLATPSGTPVLSVADGRVSFAGSGRGYGNYVRIEHADGYATLYAHLQSIDVRPGQSVTRGQVLAHSGNSGWSTGPHLYWQLFAEGAPLDPGTLARAQARPTPSS